MNLESHAINLNRTSDYPWKAFFSGNDLKSKIEKRINELAKANFERKFSKEYVGEKIIFENSEGEELKLNLSGIKLTSNRSHYDLLLEVEGSRDEGWPSYAWIKSNHRDGDSNFYIENQYGKIPEGFSLTKDSSEKLSEMFCYHD